MRPQLSVVVDLDSLRNHPGAVGGDLGGFGPLEPEACRRLACDGAVTRVLVTRQPTGHHGRTTPSSPADGHPHPDSGHGALEPMRPRPAGPNQAARPGARDPTGPARQPASTPSPEPPPGAPARHPTGPPPPPTPDPGCSCTSQDTDSLAGWLWDAITRLPRLLGGAPSQPLDVGRTSRTVTPAQRHALAVRDGGCVFPGCSRPLVWCEAHHLWHWIDGGPTDLDNLVLLCRAHHRAVHEGGWHLARDPDGGVTATPPYRRHPTARRHPRVA